MKPRIRISECYKKDPVTWAGSKFVCRDRQGTMGTGTLGFGATMREAYTTWKLMEASGFKDPH